MKYVGNTSLSPQIQDRIQNTFQQTIGLAEEGNRQEALLGCDFILRLDPLFEPARRLQERLNEGDGPVQVADLVSGEPAAADSEAAPTLAEPIPEASVDIGELIADAPDEAPLVGDGAVDSTPAEAPVDLGPIELTMEEDPPITTTTIEEIPSEAAMPADPINLTGEEIAVELPTRLAMLLEQRNFQELMNLAKQSQDQIAGNQDLQQLVSLANERLEAEPYVRDFLQTAQSAKEKGDLDGARSFLEKARELDASHPDLSRLEADLEAASQVEPPASFEPPPLTEVPLEQVSPLMEPESAEAIEGDVDEFFAAVEAQEVDTDSTAEPATDLVSEVAIDEPQVVPSLDAEPAARLDSESEQRIDDLLNEGQASFEDGQYQTAIDAWSRIFLIDIDHAEASRRIELARKLKAEVERQTEEAFHEAITKLESGDEAKAKEAFNKVLEMQPNHLGARDYLEKIESGDLSTASARLPDLSPIEEPTAETEAVEDPLTVDQEDLMPPPVSAAPMPDDLAPIEVPPTPTSAPRRKSFVLIGSAVLVLVLAIGWFVFSNWDRFFPASDAADGSASTLPEANPIERARELQDDGNTAMAVNVLRRVAPGNEHYAEAQTLIATWEAGGEEGPDTITETEPSEEILARRDALLLAAEQALARGENLLTLDHLERASAIRELDAEHATIRDQATVALDFLREERDLFDQGDWEYALPGLWRMHENSPDDPDITRLMVDSYYNLGLRDLQRGDAKSALEKFEEARQLTSGDEELNKLATFADAYSQRPADMLFRIFVKYQRFR